MKQLFARHYCDLCNIAIAMQDWLHHVSSHGDHIGHPFF